MRDSLPEIPTDDACFWLRGDAWLRCRILRSLPGISAGIRDSYGYDRSAPLRMELAAPLYTDLSAAVEAFEGWLLGESPTW